MTSDTRVEHKTADQRRGLRAFISTIERRAPAPLLRHALLNLATGSPRHVRFGVRKEALKALPDLKLASLFIAFILFCGLGHTIETVVVWHPWYRFATVWHVLTATVSVATAVAMARRLPDLKKLLAIHNRLVEANAELERTNDKLAQANADLEQFAYSASHDLQEPLRGINSFANMLKDTHEDRLTKQGHRWVEKIQASAHRMTRMVDGLLAFSRTGNGVRQEVVQLNSVFDEVLALLATVIEERDAQVTIDPLFEVEGDPDLLTLAAKNLVSNAIKYSPGQPQVRVYAEGTTLFVEDQGIGIAKEDQGKVFDIFTRLHRDEFKGTGIGLALVRRIADHHQVTISLKSDTGVGTRFALAFPLETDSVAA